MHGSTCVVFVLGGPGSGKGTLCTSLEKDYNVKHLSVGDILRQEANREESACGEIIRENMQEGKVGPKEITVTLLERAMIDAKKNTRPTLFLIDGFPRKMNQALHFESNISKPSLVLCLTCPPNILLARLLSRKSNRTDDVVEIINKRIETFRTATKPVLEWYEERGLVVNIDAAQCLQKVYDDVIVVLKKTLGSLLEEKREDGLDSH